MLAGLMFKAAHELGLKIKEMAGLKSCSHLIDKSHYKAFVVNSGESGCNHLLAME
jgi:hypothetical protein